MSKITNLFGEEMAERAAAERAAARDVVCWPLSDAEKAVVRGLGEKGGAR